VTDNHQIAEILISFGGFILIGRLFFSQPAAAYPPQRGKK